MTQQAFEQGSWHEVVDAHPLESHDSAEWVWPQALVPPCLIDYVHLYCSRGIWCRLLLIFQP
jgi:hypothetical protein